MTIEERNAQNLARLEATRARLDRQRIIEPVPSRNVLFYVVAVEVLAAAVGLIVFLN